MASPSPILQYLSIPTQQPRALILSLLSLLTVALTFPIYTDYKSWLSLSRAGLPYNFFGYIIQNFLRPLGIPTLDTSPFSSAKVKAQFGPHADVSFLSESDIPIHAAPHPTLAKFILPQRQLTARASSHLKEELQAFIASLATAQPAKLYVATSAWERHGDALFVREVAKGSFADKARGEVVHMHALDGSLHAVLTPGDAKMVVERGWGERFGLAGRLVPSGYTMIYAPGTEEELDVVKKIVRASMGLLLGEGKTA